MSQGRTTNLLETTLGSGNPVRVDDTAETTPDSGYEFCSIQAETNVVINTTTGNITNFDGATIASEGVRYGRWSSITLTSGTAILYQLAR